MLISAYFVAGLTLKTGDDLLDELDKPRLAWFPLVLSGILFGMIMTQSEWDLVVMTAIVVGVAASGKVDRRQFAGGLAMIVIVLLLRGLPAVTSWLEWTALLIMLFMAAVLDEKGNDWADAEVSPRATKFFAYRLTLKASVLLLCIPWPPLLPSAIALWFFDLGYELARYVLRSWADRRVVEQDYSTRP